MYGAFPYFILASYLLLHQQRPQQPPQESTSAPTQVPMSSPGDNPALCGTSFISLVWSSLSPVPAWRLLGSSYWEYGSIGCHTYCTTSGDWTILVNATRELCDTSTVDKLIAVWSSFITEICQEQSFVEGQTVLGWEVSAWLVGRACYYRSGIIRTDCRNQIRALINTAKLITRVCT